MVYATYVGKTTSENFRSPTAVKGLHLYVDFTHRIALALQEPVGERAVEVLSSGTFLRHDAYYLELSGKPLSSLQTLDGTPVTQ